MSAANTIITFDIETVADPDLVAKYHKPFEPKHTEPIVAKIGHLKDPIKIAEKKQAAAEKEAARLAQIEKDRVAHFEKAALDPHVSRVVSFHYHITKAGCEPFTDSIMLDELDDAKESTLLRSAFRLLEQAGLAVTFNGQSFDVPFMLRRALLLRVPVNVQIEMNKYRVTDGKSNHIDVRRVLAETFPGNGPADFAPGKLEDYAKLLLGESKTDGVDGSKIGELFAAGDFDTIKKYGERDALLTYRIFQKLQGFYFV